MESQAVGGGGWGGGKPFVNLLSISMGCFTESNWRFVTDVYFGCLPSMCGLKPFISQLKAEHRFVVHFKLNFPNGSEFGSLKALPIVRVFCLSVLRTQ